MIPPAGPQPTSALIAAGIQTMLAQSTPVGPPNDAQTMRESLRVLLIAHANLVQRIDHLETTVRTLSRCETVPTKLGSLHSRWLKVWGRFLYKY